jgi:hypothetical protein
MAIGKTGSFATVEPAIVDFGGMAQGAVDRIEAQKQKKRKAEEDKRKEIEKIGGMGALKSTNIKGLNQGLYSIYSDMKKEYADAGRNGDTEKMRSLQEEVFSMNNIVDNVVKQHEFYLKNEGKFDANYFQRAMSVLDNMDIANMDVSRNADGKIEFTVYGDPERTEVLFDRMSPNEMVDALKIPYKFDEEAMVKQFVKNYALDDVETLFNTQGLVGTKKESLLENNPRVLSQIKDKAKTLTNDSRAMAWYSANELGKYETDVRGFTTEEKEEAYKFFEKKLKDAYKDEVDLAIQQKRTASSGRQSKESTLGVPQEYDRIGEMKMGVGGMLRYSSIKTPDVGQAGLTYGNQKVIGVVYDPTKDDIFPVLTVSEGGSASEGDRSVGGGSFGVSGRFGKATPEVLFDKADVGKKNTVLDQIKNAFNFNTIEELRDYMRATTSGGGTTTPSSTVQGGNVR